MKYQSEWGGDKLCICFSDSGTWYMLIVMQLDSILRICSSGSGSFHHMRSDSKTALTAWGSRYFLSFVRKKLSRNQYRGSPSGLVAFELFEDLEPIVETREPMVACCLVCVFIAFLDIMCWVVFYV